jgi:hypothetical protein
MISKVILGKSFGGCCTYVMGKAGATILSSNDVRVDKVGNTTADFELVRRMRSSVRKAVIHASISFAHEDKSKLNDQLMMKIADRFLEKIGIRAHQFICVKHTDAAHAHFHLVVNRIGFGGELASDRFIRNRAAHACDELEVEFGMTVARGHGKQLTRGSKSPRERTIKERIRLEVENSLTGGVKTIDQLAVALKSRDIELRLQRTQNGKVNGVSLALDGFAFKGSSIDKRFSFQRLSKALGGTSLINEIFNNEINQNEYEK